LCGAHATAAEQGRDDLAVGVRLNGVLDGGGERRNLCHKRPQDSDEGMNAIALGVGLELAGDAARCVSQPREQLGGAPRAGVRVASKECSQALLAETGRRLWRRVALEEVERDRRVDVREDLGSAGPELTEQRAQLVRERDASLNEIVACADEATQCLG